MCYTYSMTKLKIGAKVIGTPVFMTGHVTGYIIAIWADSVKILTDHGDEWEVKKVSLTYL